MFDFAIPPKCLIFSSDFSLNFCRFFNFDLCIQVLPVAAEDDDADEIRIYGGIPSPHTLSTNKNNNNKRTQRLQQEQQQQQRQQEYHQ
jgi:hypothetical protein